jgi:hypothetical protein
VAFVMLLVVAAAGVSAAFRTGSTTKLAQPDWVGLARPSVMVTVTW